MAKTQRVFDNFHLTRKIHENTTVVWFCLIFYSYSICIRGEEDYCCIAYEKCSDANSFTIKNDGTGAVLDTNCAAEDYIGIDGAQATCDQGFNAQLHTKLCGVNFNVADATAIDLTFVCDCSAPFIVDIYTDAIADDATATSRGVCLEYRQIQCTNWTRKIQTIPENKPYYRVAQKEMDVTFKIHTNGLMIHFFWDRSCIIVICTYTHFFGQD